MQQKVRMGNLQWGARTDAEWIQQLKSGNPVASDDLIQAVYELAMQRALRKRFGHDVQTHEDVAVDAALAAHKRLMRNGIHNFNFDAPFRSYCSQIVMNELYRRVPKTSENAPFDIDDEWLQSAIVDSEVDQLAIRQLMQPCFDALEEKSAVQHRAMILSDLDEIDSAEIAAELGKTVSYVYKLKERARKFMRTCLESHGYFSANDVSDSARK